MGEHFDHRARLKPTEQNPRRRPDTALDQSKVAVQYEYDPDGNQTQIGSTGTERPADIGFAGYFQHVATPELSFALNRVYSPPLGRWLTRDPIGNGDAFWDVSKFNATDLNRYAYAGNNPVSEIENFQNQIDQIRSKTCK